MNDATLQPPIERFYDLNRLSEAGYETSIALAPEDLAKLAAWANVSAATGFEGHIALRREAASRFTYEARLEADIVQPCAITLEPVSPHISLAFTRSLHLAPQLGKTRDGDGELTLGAGEDGVSEEIDSPRFDLMAPLLEEFLLALDPYPRAEGVEFAVDETPPEEGESPFAVLKRLQPK